MNLNAHLYHKKLFHFLSHMAANHVLFFSARLPEGESEKRKFVRIYHESEAVIEKSVPRITVWHHEACRVMPNGDPEGWFVLSNSHTNDGLVYRDQKLKTHI